MPTKEMVCEYARRWRERNPEKAAESRKKWKLKNPEKMALYKLRYRKKHPHEARNRYRLDPVYREATRLRSREYHRAVKEEVLAAYGSICVCCGESEKAFLTIDHFGDDRGKLSKKKYRGYRIPLRGLSEYIRLRRLGWPKDGIRVLCFNCNCGRRDGPCPHEIKRLAADNY